MKDNEQGFRIVEGDALERVAELEPASIQTCVTSPPYWGLRDYGSDGQLGLEATPEAYVANMVEVFREVRRVLRDDGTLWLNLGDSYAGYWGDKTAKREGRRSSADTNGWTNDFNMNAKPDFHSAFDASGIKPKDLVGIPWMVAFALRADGWYLRSDIIWAKPNPMPESVTDRPTKAHEYLFLLSKSPRYYYDADAIREELGEWSKKALASDWSRKEKQTPGGQVPQGFVPERGLGNGYGDSINPAGRNRRSVWTVTTQPFPGAHFATFPPKLIEPCILAGSATGDTVLDPFAGSGTTGMVALRHDRSFIGIELSPEYAAMARNRIYDDAPLLNVEMAS